jgi:hypothetical protein
MIYFELDDENRKFEILHKNNVCTGHPEFPPKCNLQSYDRLAI